METKINTNFLGDNNDGDVDLDDLAIQSFNNDSEDKSEDNNSNDEISRHKAEKADEVVNIPKVKLILVRKLLANIKENNSRLLDLLSEYVLSDEENICLGQISDDKFQTIYEGAEGKIIEGIFDGEQMIGPDGKQYSVPANYASKSKLVEGDIMKLTITDKGSFIFKQIGPIERTRIIATLERAGDGVFYAVADGRKWRLLTASITYYKGEPGDEVVIITPKHGESKWAAVDNVVKQHI